MEIKRGPEILYTQKAFDLGHQPSEKDIQSIVAFDKPFYEDTVAFFRSINEVSGITPTTPEKIKSALENNETFIIRTDLSNQIIGIMQYLIKNDRAHLIKLSVRPGTAAPKTFDDMLDTLYKIAGDKGINRIT
jgi:hypothetical protein